MNNYYSLGMIGEAKIKRCISNNFISSINLLYRHNKFVNSAYVFQETVHHKYSRYFILPEFRL